MFPKDRGVKWSVHSEHSSIFPACSMLNRPSFIAEGNNVIVHTFSIHHDPRNFSDPDSFLPERWLSQDPNRPSDFIHKPNAFIPFSVGPQNCAGKGLAILELRAVVSFLVQRFDITAKGGPEWEQWEDGIEDWFATMLPPLPVHLKMRH